MSAPHAAGYAYGLWPIVLINIGLFIGFLYSFSKPNTKIEWRSFGLLSSFIVALFVEMYGFPLTIYFLMSWLGSAYPAANPFSHESGHLWGVFFGIGADHGTVLHFLSNVFLVGGAIIVAKAWSEIHKGKGKLVTTGAYGVVRHPQYVGFIAVIVGFLIQWPTLITLLMAPILIVRYVRLAKKEERDIAAAFGEAYAAYAERVPAWLPAFRGKRKKKEDSGHGVLQS